MNDLEGSYRKNIVRVLRDAPKKDRPNLLRFAKGSYSYINTHSKHNFESFDIRQSRSLEKIVKGAHTIEDLKTGIQTTPLFIRNKGMHGMDHSEHLLKRVDVANTFSYPDVLPETAGLRDKVASLLRSRGIEPDSTIQPLLYKEYLGERVSAHGFTDEELDRVAEKVPVDLLCSLDTDIEDAAFELNALVGTKTKFSCSGHADLPNPDSGDSYAYSGYLAFSTNDNGLVAHLRKLVGKSDTFGVALENQKPGEFTVRFRKLVPDEWIRENSRKSKDELFEVSKQKLAPILGPEILTFPLEEYKQDEHNYIKGIKRLQSLYLQSNPEAATLPYGWNSILLTNIQKFIPNELEWGEYKDYYLSPEAENDRLTFLKTLTDSIAEYRREHQAR